METLQFDCEVITPMFLAGADGDKPEIRPASIKGMLRFWWRALHGDLVGQDGSLLKLKEREAELFGGVGNNARKSKVTVRVVENQIMIDQRSFGMELKYLLYGAEKRKFIKEGSTFKIILQILENDREKLDKIKEDLNIVMSLIHHLSGIGAKSRNGFGSINVQNRKYSLKNLIDNGVFDGIPRAPYTSISENCQIFNSIDSYENITSALKNISSFWSSARKKIQSPERGYIALPYGNVKKPPRHSKIFFMKIFKIKEDGKFLFKFRITYLPYDYLNSYPEIGLIDSKMFNKINSKVEEYIAEDCSDIFKSLID